MITKTDITEWFKNKNFLMFFVSLIFMSGIMAYFTGNSVLFGFIFTVLVLILRYFEIIDIRKILLFLLIFYAGFFLTFFKIKNGDDLLYITPVNSSFSGRVVSIPVSQTESKLKFFFEVEKYGTQAVKGKTLVSLNVPESKKERINIGDKLLIKGNLRRPPSSANPSQFDYFSYLKNFNTFTVLYSNDGEYELIKEESSQLRWRFLSGLNNTRNKILNIHSKYLKSPNLEILGGIVFGDDAVAPPEYVKKSFVNSGLLHILAASGMNVGFIYAFWFFIMMGLRIPYKLSVISGIFVVALYTLMTGLGASVVRAALMLIFVLIGKLIDRDTHSVSLLSFIAVLMLIYNPAYINDVSFQLSFVVTFGLLIMGNITSQKIEKIPDRIKMAILIPIVAQIWVAPIQMFYFNTFSIYAVPANICCVTLVSIISFAGFISSIFSLIPYVGNFICLVFDFFTNYLLNILVTVSNFFGSLPHCVIQTTHPEVIQLILYYSMLLSVVYLFRTERYKKAFVVILIVSSILGFLNIKIVPKDLEIIAFSVQNADSFLIKTPEQKYFFIDTGKASYKSTSPQAKIIMLKYLKDRGIKDIEGVIVTHFDNDHSGGTSELISNLNVKTLYLNNTKKDTQTAQDIFKTVSDIGQNTKIVENNSVIYSEPDLKMVTYKANIKGARKDNENSTVTLLSYKDFDMLFMGDAGVESFNSLKKNIPHNVEVLKVGHHGAYGVVDESMMKHLNSKVSVVSTGINNYGHPAKITLDTLENTKIYRTDLYNSVKISTDGNNYSVSSYNPKKRRYEFLKSFNAD